MCRLIDIQGRRLLTLRIWTSISKILHRKCQKILNGDACFIIFLFQKYFFNPLPRQSVFISFPVFFSYFRHFFSVNKMSNTLKIFHKLQNLPNILHSTCHMVELICDRRSNRDATKNLEKKSCVSPPNKKI